MLAPGLLVEAEKTVDLRRSFTFSDTPFVLPHLQVKPTLYLPASWTVSSANSQVVPAQMMKQSQWKVFSLLCYLSGLTTVLRNRGGSECPPKTCHPSNYESSCSASPQTVKADVSHAVFSRFIVPFLGTLLIELVDFHVAPPYPRKRAFLLLPKLLLLSFPFREIK